MSIPGGDDIRGRGEIDRPDHETNTRERLKFKFIGEGLVLSAAIGLVARRGHIVSGVFCTSKQEYMTLTRSEIPAFAPYGNINSFLSDKDFDVLLSINNGHILNTKAINAARIASVNYHNGPLPAYAGRWVTAWAILNGEVTHGITWHLIASGIDTGAILEQRHFPLADGETTGTLNLRCTQAAVESFSRVLEKLENKDPSACRKILRRGATSKRPIQPQATALLIGRGLPRIS